MAWASGCWHSPHRRASPSLPVYCAGHTTGNGHWQRPTDPSRGSLGRGGRQVLEESFARWAPRCQWVYSLCMTQKHDQKHECAGTLPKCCPGNQVLVHISPPPCPTSVSPSGCCKPSKLRKCRRSHWALRAVQGHSPLEKQNRGFAPSLYSKTPLPELL